MSKIYLIFFFYTLTLLHSFADEQTIWITPSETDYSRLSTGLAGSNITIIGEDEIKNSKNSSIPEIISSHSGIQLRNLFSNVNSTGSTLDLRGFGESAKNNSVILLNGRRLNDIDMAGVNFSAVPKVSIKRIEVIRGGSASTLYGNGAVGGAINIVTKNVTDTTSKLKAGIASHNSYSSDFSMPIIINENSGVLLSASINESDTYRQRSDFESESYLIRYNIRENNNDYYLDINDSSYSQLLPGARYKGNLNGFSDGDTVTCNLLSDSKTAFQKGTHWSLSGQCLVRDPDYANFETVAITTGADLQINKMTDLHVSLASRDKEQRAFTAGGTSTLGYPTSSDTFNFYELETDYLSLRADHKTFIGENLASLSVGIDFQDTDYAKKSSQSISDPFGGFVYASQEGSAIYSQNSVNLINGKSILSLGFRSENAKYKVNESFDTSVSKFASSTARDPYQTKMNNTAANIGVEYILDNQNTLFFKYAEAFRTPDLDARNSTCASAYSACSGTGTHFYLKDQTSDELEFGIRHVIENLSFTSSIFEMNTLNEIRYVPYANNTNLDPIKRKGLDVDFNYNLDEKTSINGSFSYIDAHFTSGSLSRGAFQGTYAADSTTASERMDSSRNLSDGTYNIAGLRVPLVAEYAYNLGLDYKMPNDINFKLGMSFVDEMFVSNDQENIEPTIPSYYLFDLSLDAKNDYGYWSFGIDNIFNTSYYTFATASSSHGDSSYGIQNMYPLERRSIFLDYSYEF